MVALAGVYAAKLLSQGTVTQPLAGKVSEITFLEGIYQLFWKPDSAVVHF